MGVFIKVQITNKLAHPPIEGRASVPFLCLFLTPLLSILRHWFQNKILSVRKVYTNATLNPYVCTDKKITAFSNKEVEHMKKFFLSNIQKGM